VESTLREDHMQKNKSVEGKKLNQQHLWKVVEAGIPNEKHLWKEEYSEVAAPLEGSAPSTQIL